MKPSAELLLLEKIHQTILDNGRIETERFKIMATQGSDILAKITAASATMDAMKTKFDTAMATIAETVPAGHSAVLDTLAVPLDDLVTKINALGAEFEAKIKSLPVPGAAPPA